MRKASWSRMIRSSGTTRLPRGVGSVHPRNRAGRDGPRGSTRRRRRLNRLLARHTRAMSRSETADALMAEEDRLWGELHGLVDSLPGTRSRSPDTSERAGRPKTSSRTSGVGSPRPASSWSGFASARTGPRRSTSTRSTPQPMPPCMRSRSTMCERRRFARNQMLRAWRSLPERSDEADRWIRKSGPEHYQEHLPRLREWVAEVGES